MVLANATDSPAHIGVTLTRTAVIMQRWRESDALDVGKKQWQTLILT